MTENQKSLILATVPILREHGVLLTTHFYARMFRHNPELKNMFNMGNQETGKQQTALAMAVLAYAENIANPGVLMPVLDRIGHKHVSLEIRPEHYLIVGHHLLASIKEVLGELATLEIMDAWEHAYNQLAQLMSGHEAGLYSRQAMQENGWTGWRTFKLGRRQKESAEITSFYLYPGDGGPVPLHKPGQFISIRVFLPELDINQIRQYSISSAPNREYYRISVKRERNTDLNINGMISNYLHDYLDQDDLVELTAPSGTFILPENLENPFVFISGGVGLTPFISMVEHLVAQERNTPIAWLHGCRHEGVHAFRETLEELSSRHRDLKRHIFYSDCSAADKNLGVLEGHLDINMIENLAAGENTQYYLCGPSLFIEKQFADLRSLGILPENIHYEEFGPQVINLN